MTFPTNWTDVGATGSVDDPSTQWRMVAVEDHADPRRNVWVASWHESDITVIHVRGGREGDDMAVAARLDGLAGDVEFFDWLHGRYARSDTVLMELLNRLAQCRKVTP